MTSSSTDGSSSHDSSQVPSIGGKWLIMGILATALAMASFGWWFRFQATHQAAQFWGPEAARLIRDAPQLFAYRWTEGISMEGWTGSIQPDAAGRDIASAPGITHLRTALLEDRSFGWGGPPTESGSLGYGLRFVNPSQSDPLLLGLSEDCRTLVRITANGETVALISSEPISAGLKEVLGEVFGEVSSKIIPAASDSPR